MSFTEKSDLRIPPLGRRLRLGFVGGGRGGLVGDWHFNGARLSNHWDVVAGALSSRPENAAASARDWVISPDRSYSDYRDMAEREGQRNDGIEAVAICTPNWSHAEIARVFLRAGIDVILDKPMTTTIEDAQMLVELAERESRVLVVTYPYSHHAMVRQAQDMIRQNRIGKVRQAHVEYLQDWNAGKVYRVSPKGRPELIIEGLQGAADIALIPKSQTIIVPRMKEDKVTAYKL